MRCLISKLISHPMDMHSWGVLFLCIYALFSDISLSIANFAMDMALILALWTICRNRNRPPLQFVPRALPMLFVCYYIALIIAALNATDPALSVQLIWRSIYYMAVPAFLAWRFLAGHERSRNLCLLLLVLSVSISGVYALLQSSQGIYRATGFIHMLETATHSAQALFIVMIFFLVNAAQSTKQPKIQAAVAMLFIVLLFAALLATNNRQTWLAFAASLFLLLMMLRLSLRKWISIILGFVMLLGVVMTLFPAAGWRMHMMTDLNDRSANVRLVMWRDSWELFKRNPVLGIGPGNMAIVPLNNEKPPLANPHSTYVQLLVETGVIGFLSYLAVYVFICAYLLRLYRRTREPMPLIALTVTIVTQLCGITENYLFGVVAARQMEWFIIGMALKE